MSERSESSSPEPIAPNIWQKACRVLFWMSLLGFAVGAFMGWAGWDQQSESSSNIFLYLFSTYDRWFFLLLALGALTLRRILRNPPEPLPSSDKSRVIILWASIAVLVIGSIGVPVVFANYAFSMDEFYSDFQAAIFAKGKLFSSLSPDLAPIGWAAAPINTCYNPAQLTWTSNYLPVYALLRTPFFMAGCAWLLNPLLGGLSVLAVAGLARRLWPGERDLPVVAAILLAGSPQFLITGMTGYAMSAHLCMNLFWLLFYLHPSCRWNLLAPFLGVLAVGLHQPNVHLLFVLPFCLRLLLDRRWKMAGWYAAIYAAGGYGWLQFIHLKAVPDLSANAKAPVGLVDSILSNFSVPAPDEMLMQLAGALLVPLWQSLALALFAGVVIYRWRTLPPVLKDLLASLVLPAVFYFFVPLNQGHGWGNRYFFPSLGSLVLLGVAGFRMAREEIPARRILWLTTAASVLLILPLRCWEAGREVRPFANASRFIQSLPAKVFVVNTYSIWYGQDLVRNASDLTNSPKLIFQNRLNDEVLEYCRKNQPTVPLGFENVARFGLKPRTLPKSLQK